MRERIGLLELLHPAGAPDGTATVGPSPPRWLVAGEPVESDADLVAVDAAAGAPDDLARRAVALGAEAVGVDPTRNQIAVAQRRAGGPRYGEATAEGLPFRDASFD
ncbi:MAG TPA: methyltransferase domain-containing protein, partial [Gaiella sp.]|nr:methyltransferase domain-containing protein [Gaiella sp.]